MLVFTRTSTRRVPKALPSAPLAGDCAAHSQGLDRSSEVDGVQIEGTFRSHQVPVADVKTILNTCRSWRTG